MQLKSRLYDEKKDYEEIREWWKKHKWAPIPKDHLPGTGIIIYDDEGKYCAAWLYITNSKFGLFEWLVTNKDTSLRKRIRAIDMTVKEITKMAKQVGVGTLFSSIHNGALEKFLTKYGYKVTDKNMTNLLARIQ